MCSMHFNQNYEIYLFLNHLSAEYYALAAQISLQEYYIYGKEMYHNEMEKFLSRIQKRIGKYIFLSQIVISARLKYLPKKIIYMVL